ncbi:MAG: MarR family transcriptional regulator [Oscillospiraceae bacterium]|nr:MarR family transcriptional regulator [Oscillospiraceae bacterium]
MNIEHVGKHIMVAAHQIKVSLDSIFDNYGLNGLQVRILGFIARNDDKDKDVYQKDIETEFKIRRSSVTSVLNTMEKNGYIQRQSVKSDARLKKIVLTDKAKQVGKIHHDAVDRFEQSLLDNMTGEEISTLKMLLDKVVDNLDSIERC